MAVVPWPGGLPLLCGLPGVASTAMHALRRLTVIISSRSLTWTGAGFPAEDSKGAVVERVESGDHTAMPDP